LSGIAGNRARNALLVLVLIVGAGNLVASRLEVDASNAAQAREQAAQKRQGKIIDAKICTTMARLAALRPPAGSPSRNPSRAFDDNLHATLDELGPDLGCS
jgi:hypothetical protein